jgi:hypothetical protein
MEEAAVSCQVSVPSWEHGAPLPLSHDQQMSLSFSYLSQRGTWRAMNIANRNRGAGEAQPKMWGAEKPISCSGVIGLRGESRTASLNRHLGNPDTLEFFFWTWLKHQDPRALHA